VRRAHRLEDADHLEAQEQAGGGVLQPDGRDGKAGTENGGQGSQGVRSEQLCQENQEQIGHCGNSTDDL